MKQQTLTGFEKYGKTTRRAKFLADMDRIIPWPEMTAAVQTVYPKISENGGRPPIALERMLRIYFLQLWFNLSDPAVEEALYDSVAMRSFVGIDLGVEGAPDETTVCKFRHLLERAKLGKVLLKAVNDHLRRNGIKISNGTIVDATIIGAPSSTKNKDGKRDPEMHQVAKGNQWYFGMKAHIGVDSKTKVIHTILASAANVSDALALPHLLHGKETRVWGDQAYRGQKVAMHKAAPRARDFTNQRYRWGSRVDERIKAINRNKSRVRAKVEHTIGVIKRVFGFQKARYRGLAKNLHRLEVTAALANLYTVRRRLLAA
ncbi:MAG: IS5 family transposase [Proteobacteria bacterium]|nr:IS5 family transposase [Pseudomonadota bacterium]